jgi:parallel beta-helix repeat protein
MLLGVVCIRPVKAQYQNSITINADGSVTPSTAPIQQTGNVYTLTNDEVTIAEGVCITVQRSSMILDGNGHTLSSTTLTDDGDGLSLSDVSNVTLKNFIITDCVTGIELDDTSNVTVTNNTITQAYANHPSILPTCAIGFDGGSSNIITGNTIVNNMVGIDLDKTSNNLIVENNITNSSTDAFYVDGSSNNSIYHNNFINNAGQLEDEGLLGGTGVASVNIWDSGYSSGGNYWSDYQSKYPNASQVDSSGIGNTPYVIDENNIDHYPLIHQVDISATSPTPTSTTTSPTSTPTILEFPTWIILPLFAVVMLLSTVFIRKRTPKK